MSVNKNCMFALALREGESTHISAIDNFQFWNNSFTLTMSFFQTGESDEVVLFNQEGIIKVGYRNSIFYVKISDKEFLSEEGRMVVMPKVWNSISVAYDVSSKIVSAYINGIKDFEADLALEGELPVINSTGDYVLGEKFIGYFRKVFCYAGIHTEDEMFQIDNIDPVDATEHEFYLDFSAKEPKDIGKYGKNIFTTCFAFNKNIIPTIDFGECGYISSEGSEEVLSDDYTESAFTIVSKIYISDSRSSHILFAKENEACNGFFIGVFCTDGNPRLFFKNGETNVAIDRTLPLYTWLDLAFVCSNKRIQVFCDGEEFGECELPGELAFSSNKFTIGNAATQFSYKSFCGYIDYVAVFNGVKAKDELKKYISDIPYIYSKDISALYYLSDVNAVELINSKKIIINESVCCFAEDTQRVETDMLTYDNECENEISISSYDQWQGSLAAGLFLGSISSMGIRHRFGLDSNGMPTQSVAREFTKRVSSIPEHMEICLNSTSITPAMTQSYLSALESAGILGSLGTLFGISSFEVDKFAIAILGAAAIGACSVLIATACEKGSDIILNNDNKEPPEQDPEDEKTVVYLKSITFAHNPQDKSSAVYLRRSENQSSSEWELGQTDATDALYIADRHENVSVKATIVFNKPFVGTILAKAEKTDDGILGDLEETKITVDSLTYPVEVEVSLKLARANFIDVKLGNYIDNLTWATRSEKGQIILDTSSHRTWILETEPLEQWNILEKDEARNISIDTLKILDEIRKYDSSKEAGCKLSLTDTDSWLKQMVHFIHDSGMFKYNYESEYKYSSYREVEDLSFFVIREFEKDYYDRKRTDSIILSSLDTSNLIIAFSKLLKMSTVGLSYLITNNNCPISLMCDTSINTVIQDSDYILFSNAYVMGAETMSQIGIYNKYFIVCSQQKEYTLLYDSVISVSSNTNEITSNTSRIYLYGKKFTCDEHSDDWLCLGKNTQYYRESCIAPGTNCHYSQFNVSFTLSEKLNEKVVDPVNLNPQISKVAIVDGKIKKVGRVEQFEESMKEYYGVGKNDYPVLAHKVSYSYIQAVIVHTINLFRSQQLCLDGVLIVIDALLDLVFGNTVFKSDKYDFDLCTKNIVRSQIAFLFDYVALIDSQSQDDQDRYCQILNEAIKSLTMNSYFNIKVGMSRWNSSIGDYIDLEPSWATIYHPNGDIYHRRENIVDCILAPKTPYSVDNNNVSLVVCDVDAFRLRKIYEIANMIKITTVPKLYKTGVGEERRFFASCSNSSYLFDEVLSTEKTTIDNFDIFSLQGELILRARKQKKDSFKF